MTPSGSSSPATTVRSFAARRTCREGRSASTVDRCRRTLRVRLHALPHLTQRFLIPVDNFACEHAAGRGGTNRLNAATREWAEKIETFRKSLVGDSCEFSGYAMEGFVLLPELVLTPRRVSRQTISFRTDDLAFTRAQSFSQFAAMLEMVGWPRVPCPQEGSPRRSKGCAPMAAGPDMPSRWGAPLSSRTPTRAGSSLRDAAHSR